MRVLALLLFSFTFFFGNLHFSKAASLQKEFSENASLVEKTNSNSPTIDSLALVALYNATNGPIWNNTWNLSAPMTTWFGISLNANRRVVDISLGFNNLVGTLPPEIGDLNELINLNVQYNQLYDAIPPEIGDLNKLKYLFLANNSLNANIPPEIGDLSLLESCYLNDNILTGSIPPELGMLSNLVQLNLSFNQLTGSIPPELGDLSNVYLLLLDNNNLTGNIPPEIGNLGNLSSFFVNDNDLSGCIPAEMAVHCNIVQTPVNGVKLHNNPNLSNQIWANFCASMTGQCNCVSYLNLPGTIATGLYEALSTITSNGTINSGSTIDYQAGRCIILDSNFTVNAGADFVAEIQTCN